MPSTRNHHLAFLLLSMWAIIGLLAGCAAIQKSETPVLAAGLAPTIELETVPFYPQKAYQCGPSSLAMALTYSDLPITPDALKDQVYTPSQKGSLQIAMIGATRRQGRIAYPIQGLNSLWPEIAAGYPVIVLQNLGLSWIPVWHYAVAVGYDFQENCIILRTGITERKLVSFARFEKTWARSNYWGMIVLKPTQLPAVAREKEYLAAVYGLERSRQFQAATEGYQTALTRWPQSLIALMGLGNSRYALGDLNGAEDAFRRAIEHHPHAAAAYNNLAQVLSEQGRKREAIAAARKAVAIGGPMSQVYDSTLREVQEEK
jgi:tetratricopeptide (TPR) repeat protein